MIDAGKLNAFHALNARVQIEQQGSFPGSCFGSKRTTPTEPRVSLAAHDADSSLDTNHVAGGQLHRVCPVGVFDNQVDAIVFIGLREEQGRRQIRADPMPRASYAGLHGASPTIIFTKLNPGGVRRPEIRIN